MIVWLDPPANAPPEIAGEVRRIALTHPGEHLLKIRAGGHVITLGDRVDVCGELVGELEDLDFTVGVEA